MARYKTFTNGGSLLPGDLDAMEDDYEVGFATYKVLEARAQLLAAGSSGTVFFQQYNNSGGVGNPGIWLDGNRYWGIASTSTVNPRVVQYNLGVSAWTGSTAVGTVTFTVGLYAVTGSAGGNLTIGASPVTGSTVAIANPAANSVIACAYSGDFAAPAAGHYVIAVALSAATAAGSQITLIPRLQMRQV